MDKPSLPAPYRIGRARYAKGQWVIRPLSDGSGWKTIYAVAAERVGGRWVHRSGGYHVSRRQAIKFGRMARSLYHARQEAPDAIPPTHP